MAAVFPFKKNYVSWFPSGRAPRDLNPFPIEPGYGNGSGDYTISAQCDQPRHLRSKRIFRLISRPLETQRPTSARGSFHFVSLIFGKADEVDARVPGKIVEAKRLLGQLSCHLMPLSFGHSTLSIKSFDFPSDFPAH
jgi:hypothetical protein